MPDIKLPPGFTLDASPSSGLPNVRPPPGFSLDADKINAAPTEAAAQPEPAGEIPGVPRLSTIVKTIGQIPENIANSVLPLGPGPSGQMEWHVPEAIAAPARGIGSISSRLLPAGMGGHPSFAPISQDELAALGTVAGSPIGGGEIGAGIADSTLPFEQQAAKALRAQGKTENQARGAISTQFAKGVKGGAPTASDVLQEMNRAKREGQPLALVDVNNPSLGALAGATYRQGGAARAAMKGFLEKRGSEAVPRTQQIIGRHLSDASYGATAKQLAADRSARAQPLWDAAANVGPIWSDRLGQLLEQPEVQKGIRRGYAIERRNAVGQDRPFNPSEYAVTSFNEAGDPVFGKVPTMRLMMAAKEGLDAIIESEKDPLTGRPTKSGLSYIRLRDGLVDELDRLNPAYRGARDVWSGDTASLRALDDGRNFLSQKHSPEELAEMVGKMSDSDRQFFTVGVADALKNKLYRGADTPAGTRAVINTEDARMRLRPLFGGDEEAAQQFIDAIERERTMTQSASRVYGGSPTVEREVDDRTTEAVLTTAHGITRVLEGRYLAAIASGIRARQLFGGKPNPALTEAIARALSDPEIGLSEIGSLLPQKPLPTVPREVPRMAPGAITRSAILSEESPAETVTRRPTLPAVQ